MKKLIFSLLKLYPIQSLVFVICSVIIAPICIISVFHTEPETMSRTIAVASLFLGFTGGFFAICIFVYVANTRQIAHMLAFADINKDTTGIVLVFMILMYGEYMNVALGAYIFGVLTGIISGIIVTFLLTIIFFIKR